MIHLVLVAAGAYAACRMTKAIIDENRERLLLPALSVGNRPPNMLPIAIGLRRSAGNG